LSQSFEPAPLLSRAVPLSHELRKELTEVLVHSGRDYDPEVAGVFFTGLKISRPDDHRGVGPGTHGIQTGPILTWIEEFFPIKRQTW